MGGRTFSPQESNEYMIRLSMRAFPRARRGNWKLWRAHAFPNRMGFQYIFKIEYCLNYLLNEFLCCLLSQDHITSQFSNFPLFWQAPAKKHQVQRVLLLSAALPCIPAGPKSCLVKKMAWSWCSEWLGSDFCCWYAQRQTFSKLLDGFPLSIKLTDWKNNRLDPGAPQGRKFLYS